MVNSLIEKALVIFIQISKLLFSHNIAGESSIEVFQ